MTIIAKTLMVVGTGSDVGKSIVATALCRYFAQKSIAVAPFKAQNMALNSYVTIDGKEIGRAQGVQAEAAGVVATAEMNPILLKPSKQYASQVIVMGKPMKEMDFKEYRETNHEYIKEVIQTALQNLREKYELIVIEGAGSPVEMNLKDRDIVNMQVAEWADADVILVADIDRGGVFAQIVGTLALLTDSERNRVKGIIINKFRGDINLFESGRKWIEDYTGVKVLGVLPYINLPEWEEEDSVALNRKNQTTQNADIDIVVIQYPYLSNYTDFVPLELEEDVQVRYVKDIKGFGNPHVVILPGTKNTVDDLLYLRESGLEGKILEHVRQQRELVGICGGYQMLGKSLLDPYLIESNHPELKGLDLLSINTVFNPEKKTVRIKGTLINKGTPVFGYEIHMGHVEWLAEVKPMFKLENGTYDGARHTTLPVWGTFIHGVFDSDDFRHYWLGELRNRYHMAPNENRISYNQRKEIMFSELASWVKDSMKEEGLQFITSFYNRECK